MTKAQESANYIFNLRNEQPVIFQDPSYQDSADLNGSYQIQKLHFRYPLRPHVPVLRGINLEVQEIREFTTGYIANSVFLTIDQARLFDRASWGLGMWKIHHDQPF
jgi:ABC-type multidrug transport system fused ATPase/permease subunit